MKNNKLRILFVDIETSPILGSVWQLFDQNVALNQIERDWSVLSYAAKWSGDSDNKIIYKDNRKSKDIENDKELLKGIWKLLDEAHIVVGQNSVAFDIKKLNARFIKHGMSPPSTFRQIDTLKIAKKHFAFTSNKLEYLTKMLCPDKKKSLHKNYPGFELWKACIKGDKKAWNEMRLYNIQDVISLEALFHKLQPWDNKINFNVYSDSLEIKCNCGSTKLQKRGYNYSSIGKFQRYQCLNCGAWHSDKKNLLSKEKKATLKKGI